MGSMGHAASDPVAPCHVDASTQGQPAAAVPSAAHTRCYVCAAAPGQRGIEATLCDGQALCSALLPWPLLQRLFGQGSMEIMLGQVRMLHGFFCLQEDSEQGSNLAV